jgi:D-3-phosphoglycerate dehydrogenase
MSLGMKVLFFDIQRKRLFGARSVNSISDLLKEANVISIHVDDRQDNQKLISRELLSMAKNLLIINTSRGFVVDEHALIDAMVLGKVAGFGADVLDLEQGETQEWLADNQIWKGMVEGKLNIVLTPHIGGAVLENIETSEMAVIELLLKRIHELPKVN